MASYSYYKQKDYDESLRLIEYFRKINFDNRNLEYMYFLEILNNLGKLKRSSKDITLVLNTVELIDNFSKYFSENSIYLSYLLNEREKLAEIYAKRELEIVDFYIFNNNLLGALQHLISIEERFYSKEQADRINYKFFELYKHVGYNRGAEKYFKLLENNKESKWYKYAIKM
jgi:outer membrane protein assembly factor BamD (BamD/ComL family)